MTPKYQAWWLAACLPMLAVGCGGGARKEVYLHRGQAYLAAGNYEKARIEFRNALQIAPKDEEIRFENALVAEKLGDQRGAAGLYVAIIDSNPASIRARVALGRLYLLNSEPEQALETIGPAIDKHPEDAGLLTIRAAARLQLRDSSPALVDAEKAAKLAPGNEDAASVLADIYQSSGRVDEAVAVLQGAIKRIPNTTDLRLQLARMYAEHKQLSQAEALLVDLIRLKPQDKSARLQLAVFYSAADNIDAAERVLREGVKALPKAQDMKLSLAELLAVRRNRQLAERQLLDFIARDPHDYELSFALARLYEQDKDYPQAESVYKKIIAATEWEGPGVRARDRVAALRVQQSDLAGAQQLLSEVLAKSPRDDEALLLRGQLAMAHGDAETAITNLRAVLRDRPKSSAVLRQLSHAYLLNGDPALSQETMQAAVDADPTDISTGLDLAQLLLGLGKPEQAKPVIDAILKQHPDNFRALDEQFKVAAARKDSLAAKDAADAVVAADPNNEVGYYYQGVAAEMDKRFSDAVQLYSAALQKQADNHDALQALTRVLLHENRVAEASQTLDDVAAGYPKDAFAPGLKGEVLLSQKRTDEAALEFKIAIEREPRNWLPYRSLALVQANEPDARAAIATLQSGIERVDAPELLETALAAMFESRGKPDAAIQVYETGLRRNPKSELLANNLAMLLVNTQKDTASLDRAKQLSASLSGSSDPRFLDTYGWVLYKRGEAPAAVSVLQKASSQAPEAAQIWFHLGMAQVRAGQSDAARTSLARALKTRRKFPGSDEASQTLDSLTKQASTESAPKT